MTNYRLKAEPIEIRADLTPRAAMWLAVRRVAGWLVWKGRSILRTRMR